MEPITESDILAIVRRMVNFPAPHICRHSVACDLLSLLDSKGYKVTEELARAAVEADDEAALAELNRAEALP